MVVHNYDFTFLPMIKYNLTHVSLSLEKPKKKIVCHLGHIFTTDVPLLSCEEEVSNTDDIVNVYVPDVPTNQYKWTDNIKKQIKMILQIAHNHYSDYVSIVVNGSAKNSLAASAIHNSINDYTGVLYMIEFCFDDEETLLIYEQALRPLYRS